MHYMYIKYKGFTALVNILKKNSFILIGPEKIAAYNYGSHKQPEYKKKLTCHILLIFVINFSA